MRFVLVLRADDAGADGGQPGVHHRLAVVFRERDELEARVVVDDVVRIHQRPHDLLRHDTFFDVAADFLDDEHEHVEVHLGPGVGPLRHVGGQAQVARHEDGPGDGLVEVLQRGHELRLRAPLDGAGPDVQRILAAWPRQHPVRGRLPVRDDNLHLLDLLRRVVRRVIFEEQPRHGVALQVHQEPLRGVVLGPPPAVGGFQVGTAVDVAEFHVVAVEDETVARHAFGRVGELQL